MLCEINEHPRDKDIVFREDIHEYTIKGYDKKPISVTTLIHEYFPKFNPDAVIDKMMKSKNWLQSKYYGQSKEEIKAGWEKSGEEASGSGTIMHKSIEDYLNGISVLNNSKEFSMFKAFWNDFCKQYPSLKPYRTEWIVFDESVGVAGSIDCILSNEKGELVILDWKRSKEIKMSNNFEKGLGPFCNLQNCNYHHYSLQLNFYRHILETKYNKKVIFMMLVVLHPNQSSYKCYPVTHIPIAEVWPTITTNMPKH